MPSARGRASAVACGRVMRIVRWLACESKPCLRKQSKEMVMNYILLTLLAISVIISIVILIIFILLLGVWMKGSSSLAFPGLGLIVATPLVLMFLLVAETVIVLIAAYLVRLIPIGRLLFGEINEP